ncbi:UNKNOWN [Stylonychia lemnae]|uniref:Uncharacterized protein n=1 Tax=Stylonychia lemnae TaxID=5949 RepID=A0A078A9D9_STYLE|nr:UNKNOWN [Stylonychia lemnae]|eukprot:CDW78471.1 UNKNOWN [Stylonychia lemnae]
MIRFRIKSIPESIADLSYIHKVPITIKEEIKPVMHQELDKLLRVIKEMSLENMRLYCILDSRQGLLEEYALMKDKYLSKTSQQSLLSTQSQTYLSMYNDIQQNIAEGMAQQSSIQTLQFQSCVNFDMAQGHTQSQFQNQN